MTPERFKAIRKALGWSLAQTRDYLCLKSERTIRRFERGDTPISGPVAKLMEQATAEDTPVVTPIFERYDDPRFMYTPPKAKAVEWPTTVNFSEQAMKEKK